MGFFLKSQRAKSNTSGESENTRIKKGGEQDSEWRLNFIRRFT